MRSAFSLLEEAKAIDFQAEELRKHDRKAEARIKDLRAQTLRAAATSVININGTKYLP